MANLELVAIKIKDGVVYWKLSDGNYYEELPVTLLLNNKEEAHNA